MSFDDPAANRKFRVAESFQYPLWSDGDKALARHYGVVRTDLQPYASRVTVILDARGAIIERLPNDALSPAPADHAQAALDVLNRMAAAKP